MGIFFLATSSPERAVWLSFGFYLLNLLVLIIPAVIDRP
jgi:heme exporter protein D